MSYLTQDLIATNQSMLVRVAQCAAQQGVGSMVTGALGPYMNHTYQDPDVWTTERRRFWSAAPDWDTAWEYALNVHTEADYDPGADGAVITDEQILSQVQSMLDVEPV